MEIRRDFTKSTGSRRRGRQTDRRGCKIVRPVRQLTGRHSILPTGGRCRNRNGSNQFCCDRNWKRICRYLGLCHGCFGRGLKSGPRGTGSGNNTIRRYRGNGTLQQLYFRSERMGRTVPRICRNLWLTDRYERSVWYLIPQGIRGRQRLRRLTGIQLFLRRAGNRIK